MLKEQADQRKDAKHEPSALDGEASLFWEVVINLGTKNLMYI